MSPRASFEALPDAIVPLGSYHDLKSEVLQRCTTFRGMAVKRCRIQRDEVHVQVECPNSSLLWCFYGYVEDVAHNIQLGLLPVQQSKET